MSFRTRYSDLEQGRHRAVLPTSQIPLPAFAGIWTPVNHGDGIGNNRTHYRPWQKQSIRLLTIWDYHCSRRKSFPWCVHAFSSCFCFAVHCFYVKSLPYAQKFRFSKTHNFLNENYSRSLQLIQESFFHACPKLHKLHCLARVRVIYFSDLPSHRRRLPKHRSRGKTGNV